MASIIDQIASEARRRWPSWNAAALLSVALGFGLLVLLAGIDLSTLTRWHWVAIAVAAAAPWAGWAWTRRISRHRRGSVGFGVALVYDDPDQARRLQSDFLEELRRRLVGRRALHPFHFIAFPEHVAKKLRSREDAEFLARKSHSHFLIYGSARQRPIAGEGQHVLELFGLVLHSPTSPDVAKQLSSEFGEVLPRTLLVAQENDLFTLAFTAAWVDVAARYIVGIASLISGDLAYAEDLFKGLEEEFEKQTGALPPSIAIIKNRLPQRLADVYKVRVNLLSQAFWHKRDRTLLEEAEPWLEKLHEYDDAYYTGHLQRAICAFVLRRDIQEARAALSRCKQVPDPTWRYSVAFLDAYEGDLQAAYNQYKKAFRLPLRDETVPVQSEEFIHIVLDEEPEQSQLHFCLGMINEHAKRDLNSARRDYERFLATTDPERYPKEHEVVRKWVHKIDMALDLPSPLGWLETA